MRDGTHSAASQEPSPVIFGSGCASVSIRGNELILVVEDDPQVARLVSLVLQRNGRDCQVVADGTTALSRAQEMHPQMIFADLTIKGMNGAALCSALKAQPDTRSIPYVVLSGDRDIAEKARQCGADDYLVKPFDFPDLIRLVEKYARTES
jgi:CheY-like chemotaxis protein